MSLTPQAKIEHRLNRIYRLDELRSHHETDWLDQRLFIPPWALGDTVVRRVWLAAPTGTPTLAFEDVRLAPQALHEGGERRWLDYGVVEIPCGPYVLFRAWGLLSSEASDSHLVISTDPGLDLASAALADAERALWGLSRADTGSSAISPNRLPAGCSTTLRLDYTAGHDGLMAGYLLRFTVPRMFSRPQMESPNDPGFLQIEYADAELSLRSIDLCFESHERVDVIFSIVSTLPPEGRVSLLYQTDITYLFASTWSREDMPQWFSPVPPLAVSVSSGDPECWVYPEPGRSHMLCFEPGPPERLHLFLPGRRCRGQAQQVRGLVTDRFRNPIDRFCADWQIELTVEGKDGTRPLALAAARWEGNGVFALQLPDLAEGVYRVVARTKPDRRVVARSNPLQIIPSDQVERQLFWGHLHNHSERSDGVRTFRQLHEHGRDAGMLDFLAATDHEQHFSDNDWLQMQDITNGFHRPCMFCTLCGFEWMDICVYSWRDRLERPPTGATAIMPLYAGRKDVVMGSHGHINHLTPLPEHDENLQRFMQVYGTFGGCDTWDNPFLNPLVNSKNKPEAVASDILAQGCKLGFTGGGDIHSAHPGLSAQAPGRQGEIPCDQYHSHLFHDGLTAAIMPALDRRPLVEALQRRATYATSGPRILLEFSVSDIVMGDEGTAKNAVCRFSVYGVDELNSVEIIKDGAVVWKQTVAGMDAENVEWTDPKAPESESFYYLRVRQVNGEMAWSSPVWIRPIRAGESERRLEY